MSCNGGGGVYYERRGPSRGNRAAGLAYELAFYSVFLVLFTRATRMLLAVLLVSFETSSVCIELVLFGMACQG